MNFQFYLEKLYDSGDFKEFIDENPDAYPTSCFFEIDLEHLKNPKAPNQDKQHFDYFVPAVNKLFSFKLEAHGEKVPQDIIEGQAFPKLGLNYSFNFEDVQALIQEEMKKQDIKNEIQKLMFSLQKLDKDNKDYLVGTIFLSGMAMLKVNINIEEMKITAFKKQSFMDMINVFKKKE